MQIIKGWVEGGETHERVFDVACLNGGAVDPQSHSCPPVDAKVDLGTCERTTNATAESLAARWEDPGFEPDQHAFYYARAIENPSCRWSTWDAIRLGVERRPDLAPTIQERAWSSPIWHRP